MKIDNINIHNFRSIKDVSFNFYNYTVLIGANNQGKSNILRALRVFYNHDNLKYKEEIDFPKIECADTESWIDIQFNLSDEEYKCLSEKYKLPNNKLKLRKYLKSSERDIKSTQNSIYAYENTGDISDSLFYGARNVSNVKIGNIIYIPDVMKCEEIFKLSGPSPFRDLYASIVKKVIKKGNAFKDLVKSFEDFDNNIRMEVSPDGHSITSLQEKINDNLSDWDVKFNMEIMPIDIDQIVKNLVKPSIKDLNLDQDIELINFGQGLQRHLIFSILKIASEYQEEKIMEDKIFHPDSYIILFEEPEAFLHPTQQEILNRSLEKMSNNIDFQIVISTHSPIFVSKNIENINSLIRLNKIKGATNSYQISLENKNELLKSNDSFIKHINELIISDSTPAADKECLRTLLNESDERIRLDREAIRYLLWLDSERSCCFFADNVIICEGPSEKKFLEYLFNNEWKDHFSNKKIYFLDSGGKFQIHKFMNLFYYLGINHSVIFDKDLDRNKHKYINDFIINSKNIFTKNIDFFDKDIESYLNINAPLSQRMYDKPLNILWKYHNGEITPENIESLKLKIENLI